jgi:hypothetical protein
MKLPGKLVLIFLTICTYSVLVMGQGARAKPVQEMLDRASFARTSADETFELNIDERRFTRENFEASTAIGTDGQAGLDLRIGVALAAGRIDVLLRNVRGSVRFHATLGRILDVINNRPAPSPALPPK